jgi:hypothetical protein
MNEQPVGFFRASYCGRSDILESRICHRASRLFPNEADPPDVPLLDIEDPSSETAINVNCPGRK